MSDKVTSVELARDRHVAHLAPALQAEKPIQKCFVFCFLFFVFCFLISILEQLKKIMLRS
jgi:hypothetical protein